MASDGPHNARSCEQPDERGDHKRCEGSRGGMTVAFGNWLRYTVDRSQGVGRW
jgi:hypothetical protein